MDHNISNEIKKFNARGTIFTIPNFLLKKFPDSLMCMLSNPKFDIPIDKIDDSIYIDVDPTNIDIIMDIYNDIEIELNIYQYMDLKYLSLVNSEMIQKFSSEFFGSCTKYNETIRCDYKYCNIHTSDNKIILLNLEFYKICKNSLIKSILFGEKEEYVIKRSSIFIDVWMGNTFSDANKIISILRDGSEHYVKYINSEYIYVDHFFLKYKMHTIMYNLKDFVCYHPIQEINNDNTNINNTNTNINNTINVGGTCFNIGNMYANLSPVKLTIGNTVWGENDIAGQMLYNFDIGNKINKLSENIDINHKKLIKYLNIYGLL